MAIKRSLSTTDVEGLGHEDKLSKLIMQRNKRLREEDLPTEFVKFKEEMRDLITILVAPQTAQFREIKGELQSIKDTNANIDSSILLLTAQNKELCKKVEKLLNSGSAS
ncbi:unnamed protein product [Parnassius apollo]|uniref:(apollo) hypothetical protein n=1 Tax=Parnassius apollo TaxID=110799 RepID=A0A8S3YGB6_PARAO|nr:unnamed protein product [Parnassius apollo]